MALNIQAQSGFRTQHASRHVAQVGGHLSRGSFDVGAIVFFAIVCPLAGRSWLYAETAGSSASISSLTLNLAVGIFAWVRSSGDNCPGVRSKVAILPFILSAYGFGCCLMLLFRLPFDRLELVLGSTMLTMWFLVAPDKAHRGRTVGVGVAHHPQTGSMPALSAVRWVPLTEPALDDATSCNIVVADFRRSTQPEWQMFLAEVALDGRAVIQSQRFLESVTGRVEMRHLSENSFGGLIPERAYFHCKAGADFLLALALLFPALALMGLIGAAIRTQARGPVFFRQERIGYAGRKFIILKFRTMDVLPEASSGQCPNVHQHERITRVGQFLRRTRLDELPQIINILRGEMSWIGPRPESEALSAIYQQQIPFYRYRHVVKPGISGWAQINQGHVVSVDDVHKKLQFDFYYIKYFSPWLDILILLGTVRTIVTGFGSK